ncbi:DUF2867 domain-containing protein [Nocardioides panacisoli]|uniref:DUF2867 domain-containing protein n=1 Tax=Nocardioides panacisoli TaxID=627624 RepID=UPI001C635405|nr:DUF2867 domain-containing protein [Nocardioides panacisoli]QYJ02902.1 DUF2867 domain-containing protein [Nocardioides panacisoli]
MHRGRTLHTSWRSAHVALAPEVAWQVVASGAHGPQWYADAAPLRIRGLLDRVVRGPARHHPPPGRPLLAPGDPVGLWQVDGVDADERVLALTARVRAPGEVRLEATVTPHGPDGTAATVRMSIAFTPAGALGRGYLVADLPAREAVTELTFRHLIGSLRGD